MSDTYLNKITWNVVKNEQDKKQSNMKLTDNGKKYTIFDENGDGVLSSTEITNQLGNKLGNMSTKTLQLLQKVQDKKLDEAEELLSKENTGSSSIEGELKRRENRQNTERAIRRELLNHREAIVKQQNAYYELKNMSQYQSQMNTSMFGGFGMNPLFGGYGMNSLFGGFGVNPLFGGMGLYNSMLGGYPFFNFGQMLGSGFGLFNNNSQVYNVQGQNELNAFANVINTNVDNFRDKLNQYGITEQELFEGKGSLNFDVTHEYSISREEEPAFDMEEKPATTAEVSEQKDTVITDKKQPETTVSQNTLIEKEKPADTKTVETDVIQPCPEIGESEVEKVENKQQNRPATQNYELKQGDTLTDLAHIYAVPLDEILKLNPEIKNPDDVKYGQIIKLPAEAKPVNERQVRSYSVLPEDSLPSDSKTKTEQPAFGATDKSSQTDSKDKGLFDRYTRIYFVKEDGETLESIAKRENIPVERLEQINVYKRDKKYSFGMPVFLSQGAREDIDFMKYETYRTERPNQTLADIAKEKGLNIEELKKCNKNIDPNEQLLDGVVLTLPKKQGVATVDKTESEMPAEKASVKQQPAPAVQHKTTVYDYDGEPDWVDMRHLDESIRAKVIEKYNLTDEAQIKKAVELIKTDDNIEIFNIGDNDKAPLYFPYSLPAEILGAAENGLNAETDMQQYDLKPGEISNGIVEKTENGYEMYREYKVNVGDNLTKIANRYGTTPEILYEYNKEDIKDKDHIEINKIIKIPSISED